MQLRSTAIGCGRFSVQGLSSRPWRWSRWVVNLLAAGCGNACLITGATVLDLPRRARQSTKGSTRQSLVEQTLTTGDFVARQPTRYTPSPFVVHSLTRLFFADWCHTHESAQHRVAEWEGRASIVTESQSRGRLATSESAVWVAGPTDSCLASPPAVV